ncbi:MAG: calcium-binding protein [Myxococcaceae bacterium]|jgi:hypothetical protein|nr:calcium-binding protein [Myxococcaceae bacterium]
MTRGGWLLAMMMTAAACTDAGLYALGAGGAGGPDRAEFSINVCAPVASGAAFPVKVLFALEGGAAIDVALREELVAGLTNASTQFTSPGVGFGLLAHRAVATGLQGRFTVDQAELSTAFSRYNAFNQVGPMSHRAALLLAGSLLSGDMQTGCRGQVARTRYLVVLVMRSEDTSCNNPVFNAGIDPRCDAFARAGDFARCSECELARATEQLRRLAVRFNAGEVTVQPVVIRSAGDDLVRFQANAIARAGGTELVETAPGGVAMRLSTLNYASLQRALTLKRFIAMNANVRVRDGAQLVDSDGDGLPDEEEATFGTDPTLVDSDADGLGDGVEVRMGLKPQPGNVDVIRGCNATLDEDGDRLNDCEERVLGTDACITDSDGDAAPDLVEFLGGTNPLIPEDLADDDRDGLPNVGELEAHTDPTSADIAFQRERGYGYAIREARPTPDGRACYDVSAYNLGLVETLQRPSPNASGRTVLKGTNELHFYFQVGRENDPRGTGIGRVRIETVRFIAPATRRPRGVVTLSSDDFADGL